MSYVYLSSSVQSLMIFDFVNTILFLFIPDGLDLHVHTVDVECLIFILCVIFNRNYEF